MFINILKIKLTTTTTRQQVVCVSTITTVRTKNLLKIHVFDNNINISFHINPKIDSITQGQEIYLSRSNLAIFFLPILTMNIVTNIIADLTRI
jgi:hypothetical protein